MHSSSLRAVLSLRQPQSSSLGDRLSRSSSRGRPCALAAALPLPCCIFESGSPRAASLALQRSCQSAARRRASSSSARASASNVRLPPLPPLPFRSETHPPPTAAAAPPREANSGGACPRLCPTASAPAAVAACVCLGGCAAGAAGAVPVCASLGRCGSDAHLRPPLSTRAARLVVRG